MAIIKCKMCGGDLELVPDSTVCECAYCGTRQTVPSADSEKMLSLFHRAGKQADPKFRTPGAPDHARHLERWEHLRNGIDSLSGGTFSLFF